MENHRKTRNENQSQCKFYRKGATTVTQPK